MRSIRAGFVRHVSRRLAYLFVVCDVSIRCTKVAGKNVGAFATPSKTDLLVDVGLNNTGKNNIETVFAISASPTAPSR